MSQQGLRQAAVRAATGTSGSHEGDWHALFDAAGIAAGPFDARLLAWLNGQLGANWPDLPGAQQAFAAAQGAYDWASMGAFNLGGATYQRITTAGDARVTSAGDTRVWI